MRRLCMLLALGLSACTMPLSTSGVVSTGARARVEVFIPDSAADNPAERRPPAQRPFEIVLTNTSARPLWVAATMSYEGFPRQGFVELWGPAGRLTPSCKACGGRSPVYRVLRPGEQQHMKASLGCFVWFVEPGVYAIRATFSPRLAADTYRAGIDFGEPRLTEPPPAPPGVDVLTEDVVSEVVYFRVLAKAP